MSTLKEIEQSNILQKAISIVKSAKQELLVTMDLAEEIESPLPLEYFFLLDKKMKQGIRITRLAFGTATDFKRFNKRHKIRNNNYKCILVKSKNYKRMLLIDGKKLLFIVDNKNKRRFFYTTDLQYIKKFSQYFYKEFKIAEQSQ